MTRSISSNSRGLPSALLMTVAAAASACGPSSGGSTARAEGQRSVPVDTTRITRISVQRQIDVSGTLLSPDQAKVSSEVSGVVQEVAVELGREVKAGDVLVRLEPRELQLALERAESGLRQVEAQLGISRTQDNEPPPDDEIAAVRQAAANRDEARAAFTRAQQLNERGLLSHVDRDAAETRLKVAEANYTAALDATRSLKASLQDRRASFALARKKLADAVIKAPIEGSVSERFVQPGEFIRETTPVVTIVVMNPLRLKTAIQEKFAGAVRPGEAVQFAVEAFPHNTFAGTVAYVGPAVDQATRTFAVEAIVRNDNRQLKPGFFVKGVVGTQLDTEVLAIPDDAVSTMAGVSSVYVVEGRKIRQQTVSLGARQGSLVEVTAGLKGTELLASSNLNQLATGTSILVGRDSGTSTRGSGAATEGARR